MRRRRLPRLSPDADLVVVYFGTDLYHHRPNRDQPNKPACAPIRSPGVLTRTKSAEESGLVACADCQPNKTNE
jgi:hypothetical protein